MGLSLIAFLPFLAFRIPFGLEGNRCIACRDKFTQLGLPNKIRFVILS